MSDISDSDGSDDNEVCIPMGRGYYVPISNPEFRTPEQIRHTARERSSQLLSHWSRLRQILDRHEELIRKRWLKKTAKQRNAILLQAWPDIPSVHRPDWEALLSPGWNTERNKAKYKSHYMWPYINTEDLSRNKMLLVFLNTRGRNHPSTFSHADWEAMRLGLTSGIVKPVVLGGYTMFLRDDTTDTYGRLIAHQDYPQVFGTSWCGLGHTPGEGLIILEIQENILRFLVDCCCAILHDFDPVTITIEEVVKAEPPPLTIMDQPTPAAIAAEAPYRLPISLDFSRLRPLVAAKRSDVEEHVRALREDPGYFAEALMEWSEHRWERVLDSNGKTHPKLLKPSFWQEVICEVILDAYGSLVSWDSIDTQLSQLAILQSKYAAEIPLRDRLPEEYLHAILTLRHSLQEIQTRPINILRLGVPPSPPFRNRFSRYPEPRSESGYALQSKPTNEDTRTFYLFNKFNDEQQLHLAGLPNVVDQIEHRIQRYPKEKAMLSPLVGRLFSDLGLIARIQHELESYQPWATLYDDEYQECEPMIQMEYLSGQARFLNIEDCIPKIQLSPLGSPVEGRFYYPSDKRRTKEVTESMREAEHHLDNFWSHVDRTYTAKNEHSHILNQCIVGLESKLQNLERTSAWIEPDSKATSYSGSKLLDEAAKSSSYLNFDSDSQSSKFVPREVKEKIKTRGSGTATFLAAPKVSPELRPTEHQVFKLKSRHYKVFRTLFFQPSQTDIPGEIPWTDFLSAMTEVGFATEKLYGSVWVFTPSALDVENSISFHEPHPIAKIPFRNARRMGRRLTRTYGWHGAMFALD